MPNSPDSNLRLKSPENTDQTKETQGSSNREGKRKWTPERDAKRSEEDTSQRGEILELVKKARQESPEPEKITAFDHLLPEHWAPKRDQNPPDHLDHPLSHEEFRALSLDDLRKMRSVIDNLTPSAINDHLTASNTELEHLRSERNKFSHDYKLPRKEQEERDRKRNENADQARTINRKKVLLLDVLKRKDERGELPPEHRAYYDQERRANFQYRQKIEVQDMERRHERERDEAWKKCVEENLLPNHSTDTKLQHPHMETQILELWFPKMTQRHKEERDALKQQHEKQAQHQRLRDDLQSNYVNTEGVS